MKKALEATKHYYKPEVTLAKNALGSGLLAQVQAIMKHERDQ